MNNWLNPDNKFFSFMGKAFDTVVLNTIWLIICLPLPMLTMVWAVESGIFALLILTVITLLPIVPATTALYYAIVKSVRKERSYAVKEFFRSFTRNFKQGAVFSLLALALIFVLYIDFRYARELMNAGEPSGSTYFGVFIVIGLLFSAIFAYVCPVLSRFDMSIGGILKTSFVMATRHLLTTMALLVLMAGVLLGCYVLLPGIFFLPAVITLVASFLVEHVFKKYMPAKTEPEIGPDEEEQGQEKDEWYLE